MSDRSEQLLAQYREARVPGAEARARGLAAIETRQRRRTSLRRGLTFATAVAASALVVFAVGRRVANESVTQRRGSQAEASARRGREGVAHGERRAQRGTTAVTKEEQASAPNDSPAATDTPGDGGAGQQSGHADRPVTTSKVSGSADPVERELGPETPPPASEPAAPSDQELRGAEQAAGALARGRGTLALKTLDRLDRELARGQLLDLRAVLRIEALCVLGRTAEARGAAHRFRDTYGAVTALAPRLERSCAGSQPSAHEESTTQPRSPERAKDK